MRTLLFVSLLFLFTDVVAQEEAPEELGPLDPDYIGVHGMVLMTADSSMYASHMPLYHKPHDAQIVYRVTTDTSAVLIMVKDADMVTIKPERFNLERLKRGESFSVKADVYLGHFERGGMPTHEQVTITFEEQVYLRELKDLTSATNSHVYDKVSLGGTKHMLIHQITQPPSYDQLILLYDDQSCITKIRTGETVPKRGQTFMALSMCGPMKPLYFETQDFRSH